METNHNDLLHQLFKYDEWSEDFLLDDYKFVVDRVLSKQERFILHKKIDGWSDEQVIKFLQRNSSIGQYTSRTFDRQKRQLKKKLRDGFTAKIPGWLWNKSRQGAIDNHEDNDSPEWD